MLKKDFFKGKRVTVFGIGLNHGALATIRFLVESGVKEVIATDIKTAEELAPTLKALEKYKHVTYVLGQHRSEDFTHVDMVIKNPIIPWTNEYVKLAQSHHIPVEMDASIFFQWVKRPTIAVTGTKGKTTTSSLIAYILKFAKEPVFPVGISQVGFLGEVSEIPEKAVIVAELSSWRLSSLSSIHFAPHIAVVTNIYPDHLNYYKKMEAYVADKNIIWQSQKEADVLVLNADNPGTKSMAEKAFARIVWFSESQSDLPGSIYLKEGNAFEKNTLGEEMKLFSLEGIKLIGDHNRANILAATAAARAYGVAAESIERAVKDFSGVPHRLEFVREKDGVKYINDTAATMPEASIAGIRTFKEPVVLLAGGADKGFDYEHFAEALVTLPKAVVLFQGTATEKLLPLLEKKAKEKGDERIFPVVGSMADAVRVASEEAEPGDVVLLSPGVASYGLFRNEFDRGEQFRERVKALE